MNLSHVLSPLRDTNTHSSNNRLFNPSNIQIKTHRDGLSGVNLQQLLSDRLSNSIADRFGVRPVDQPSKAKPADFSAQKIAENVLGFIKGHIDRLRVNGASTEELETALTQARKGVELGIGQATEVLSGLGKLSGDIERGIADVGTLLTNGLNKLAEQISPTSPSTITDIKSNYHSLTKAESSSSFDLQITTQEGDQVSIQINRSSRYVEVTNARSNGESSSVQQSSQFKSASTFSFEVQGNLNAQETAAIEDLISNVNTLADEFFNGDLVSAFEQAGQLGIDDDAIASFALNLQSEQRIEVTESVYTRVSGPAGRGGSSPVDAIAAFAKDFVDAARPTAEALADRAASASSLLTEFVQQDQRFVDLLAELQDQANQALGRLTGSIADKI